MSNEENNVKTQGPVCTFCYKWCPRMLMVLGICVVINYLCFVLIDFPYEIYKGFAGYDEVTRFCMSGFSEPKVPASWIPVLYWEVYSPIVGLCNFLFRNAIAPIIVIFTCITLLVRVLRAHI